jgi:RHH-type proline utilization regulon transcriptional repressor/proline dehydrogenase/delta 1-pyrroline-5-carboxylate dehydrogenase
MVRLVKGAYWDSEIKRAQVDGLDGYPVYTRKVHTDVSYLACARKLLGGARRDLSRSSPRTTRTRSRPSTTWPARTFYAGQYEFQCLHGMGEPLYEQVVGRSPRAGSGRPCRIYAPVGTHETLLAYLVRRLLENGANTSFVNRIADPEVPLDDADRRSRSTTVERARTEALIARIRASPLPREIYGAARAIRAASTSPTSTVLARACARRARDRGGAAGGAPLPARGRSQARARDAAGAPGRLHQPVEFPAGDLHRPGRRRADAGNACSPSRPSRRR